MVRTDKWCKWAGRARWRVPGFEHRRGDHPGGWKPATASLGGTAANPTLNLGIPQGAQGAQGAPGLDAPQINDTQITTTNPWSSMQIVKTLCPPFTVSGSVVQCTPVANSPLDVQVEITPTQEGTGDPSPENVRPIVGWDSVNVTRCGKNLMPYTKPQESSYTNNGITYTWNDNGTILVTGTATASSSSNVMNFNGLNLPAGFYRMIGSGISELQSHFVVKKASTGGSYWYLYSNISIEDGDVPQYFYITVDNGVTVDATIYAFLSYGREMPSVEDYAPYTSSAAMLTLPETIYGGTLDTVTGVGSEEWELIELNGETTINTINELDNTLRASIPIITFPSTEITGYCNIFPWVFNYNLDSEHVYANQNLLYLYVNKSRLSTIDIPGVLAYLAAQASAGTPVQVAYKLATPQPIQATGNQTILALPGTNTVYTDAGDITVTGASDPIATITALQNRVSALESAALN